MFRFIKAILRLIILILVAGALLFTYARYIEPRMLKVETTEVESPLVTEAADGFRIAAFSDTHFSEYYTPEDFRRVLAELKKADPDLVLFLGDLIDNFATYEGDTDEISRLLAEIAAPRGKFAIFGNHDYGGGAERKYQSIMEAGGFRVLVNEYTGLDDLNIGIVGIDDVLIGYGVPETVSQARPDFFNLVLCHEPDVADSILELNGNLMFSSHTHGRQVNLPLFDNYILPPYGVKYVRGLYPLENQRRMQLYVTRGLGTTKLPLRFLSVPEVTVFTLHHGE